MVLPIADTFNGCRTNSRENIFPRRKHKKNEFYFSQPLRQQLFTSPPPVVPLVEPSITDVDNESSRDIGYISISPASPESDSHNISSHNNSLPDPSVMISWNSHFQCLREELRQCTGKIVGGL